MAQFLDVMTNIPSESINFDNLKAIIRDEAWAELPEALQPAQRPTAEYKVQFFLVHQVNGKLTILKHYMMKHKLSKPHLVQLRRGQCHEIKWGTGGDIAERKAFQWMLEQMGGLQVRRFCLSTEKKRPASSRPSLSEEQQEEGWSFIQKEGELDKSELEQLGWIHRHISREGSPIQGWSEKLVQRALDSLQNDGCNSAKITRWDLTIQDFEVEVVRMLESVLPHLRDHSLWLLGEPGVGKTPLGRAIAMAFSRYNEFTGAFRSASDFDVFRGVPFSKATPALYDDGDIFAEPIKKIKAFCDVGDYETILKERWTAAKFVKHQLRILGWFIW